MKTIETFLELENPRKVPSFLVSLCLQAFFCAFSPPQYLHFVVLLQNEPGQETTKKTVTDIFYPGDHDAKSILLKRGPVLSEGVDESEMLLFTHGVLFSRMEFNALLNILFTIASENPEYLSSKQLQKRFNAIDSDQSGCE